MRPGGVRGDPALWLRARHARGVRRVARRPGASCRGAPQPARGSSRGCAGRRVAAGIAPRTSWRRGRRASVREWRASTAGSFQGSRWPPGRAWSLASSYVTLVNDANCSTDSHEERSMPPAIATHDLTRRFDALTAVDALSLDVQAGEVFGLLGPNGAGKTTTIKMLITLLPPTAGDAPGPAHDTRRAPRLVRRSIGYVPQLLSSDGALTARENLMTSARLYHLATPGSAE